MQQKDKEARDSFWKKPKQNKDKKKPVKEGDKKPQPKLSIPSKKGSRKN